MMSNEEVFFADNEDPKMEAAFNNARETFKYFWRELSWEYRRIIPALNFACVKVACAQEKNLGELPVVEHMWINEVDFDGNIIQGSLVNDPVEITNYAKGDRVEVTFEQISDWLFTIERPNENKGFSNFFGKKTTVKPYGGFTVQAMRSKMSKNEIKEHDRAWGIDFGDYNEILLVDEEKEHPENLIEHPMSINMKENIAEFLKNNPVEINKSDDDGYTFLHKEAIAGNLTSIKTLIEMGANVDAKTKSGQTALDFAKKLKWEHIINVLDGK